MFPSGALKIYIMFACAAMVGSMMSFWLDSVAQANAVASLGVMALCWVIGVVSRREKPYKAIFDEILLVGCVSVRSILGAV